MYKILLIFFTTTLFSFAAPIDCPVDLGPDQEACDGETLLLFADTGGGDTYQWFFNGEFLPDETTSTLQVTQTGTYSVEVNDGGGICIDDVMVSFLPLPSPITPTPLKVCDVNSDGFASFNLASKNSEIIGGESDITITYYETEADAQAGVFALPNPYVNVTPFTQLIYARATNNTTGCFTIVELELIVNPTLVIPALDSILLCDEDQDGQEIFDLTIHEAAIFGSNPTGDYALSYHESEAAAVNNELPILNPINYVNSSNPQQIYVRLEDVNSGCFAINVFTIKAVALPVAGIPNEIIEVDTNDDGMALFDLTENTPLILGSQNPADYSIAYFTSEADASSNENPIATPEAFTSATAVIFARIEIVNTSCFATTSFSLIVEENAEDTDNDGIADMDEDLNNNGNLEDDDTDGDEIPNYLDSDDDGDLVETIDEITGIGAGFSNTYVFIDTDEDTIENYLDNDDDGDMTLTIDEDYNGNGDPRDDDMNQNNIPDFLDADVTLEVSENIVTDLQLFPNPASEMVVIKSQFFTLETTFVLYDLQGKEVQPIVVASEENNFVLNVASLQSGVYFLKVTSEAASITRKFIKM
ncbi:T9SS type A sorting domain-containing protein [Cochleicola gelatinilyticus]|uniref:Secretion system C-terminal sorting domain-containing protein n=1 Tax=Cochleicola gelatinilyticus TaxID=1763537 RepID=A0A167HGB4_9FLAO|nr:T9SS type A sorting domain-containing protein [Cochleicola gelatinilyticus]OAB78577.1 hypothetical protein ULVI_08290 [Cochleicola gelatinilyticus]